MKNFRILLVTLASCAGSHASESMTEAALEQDPRVDTSDADPTAPCDGAPFARGDLRSYFDATGVFPKDTLAKLRIAVRSRTCDGSHGCGAWNDAPAALEYAQRPVDEPVFQLFIRDGMPALVLKEREHGGLIIAVCNIPYEGTSASCTYVRDGLFARPGADVAPAPIAFRSDDADPAGSFRATVTKQCLRVAGGISTRTDNASTWQEAEVVMRGNVRPPPGD